ncbi:MAG TPA: hypothetical protein VGZ22_30050 [Isosphaeraceae bacterium]|jgi:hypothetical protein|nr:hypothetical protein [Isosphaeraceae bacterium]
MIPSSLRAETPLLAALVVAGLIMGGLLVGYEPISGDPDRMYRPLKTELARSYHEGRLPYWSDRLGLGVPLLAESHVAAFYPFNQVLYRALSVPTAYRLAMWLHYLALVTTTYAYARTLRISAWGAALAALAFTFCGFQAIQASHEWAYHTLPFLPLALLVTEQYLASGRVAWLASLALVWGTQLTLGHFQVQAWTGGLVIVTAVWRVVVDRRPWWRGALLCVGLVCGAGVAAVQLVPSWELARFAGTSRRQVRDLLYYSYPPAHWAELAVPRLFHGLPGGPEDRYWFSQQTTGYEACLYVGTVPLILTFVGLLATRRDRALWLWVALVPLTFAVATMPRWWPAAYVWWLQLPVVGFFRSPGRYSVLTSLGLSLLAGRGFDRALEPRRFTIGLALAIGFGAAAGAWSFSWAQGPILRASLGPPGLSRSLGLAAASWVISLVVLVAWRRGRLAALGPFLVAAVELGHLYYHSTTEWGWAIALPQSSPVLSELARMRGVLRVAGLLGDLPLRAGQAPAYPYLGMDVPPPNRLLEPRPLRRGGPASVPSPWLRHFGVTHGIWDRPENVPGSEVIFDGLDSALDRLVHRPPGTPKHPRWQIVHYAGTFPAARAARLAFVVADEQSLLYQLAESQAEDRVWYLPTDSPANSAHPRASSANVTSFDGQTATVEHDGTCDLVLTRTYYPGWTARIDQGPAIPVSRADVGLQAIRLPGAGLTRVTVQYEPTGQRAAFTVSIVALTGSILVLLTSIIRNLNGRKPDSTPSPSGET